MKERLKNAFADAPCREEKIQQTIAASTAALLENNRRISYFEFLHSQLPFIQKRWWAVQAVLLLTTGILLQWMDSSFGIRRCLGIAAPLFAVLILPELWKNRSYEATEVESATYFTLRQIYAARMTLFAGMDVLLLSFFLIGTSANMPITIWELAIQFVFPFCVSCCICLFCLYNCRTGSEVLPLFLCFIWAGIWLLIILDDRIFNQVSALGWGMMLAASVLFMGYCILRGQKQLQKQWEAKTIWN